MCDPVSGHSRPSQKWEAQAHKAECLCYCSVGCLMETCQCPPPPPAASKNSGRVEGADRGLRPAGRAGQLQPSYGSVSQAAPMWARPHRRAAELVPKAYVAGHTQGTRVAQPRPPGHPVWRPRGGRLQVCLIPRKKRQRTHIPGRTKAKRRRGRVPCDPCNWLLGGCTQIATKPYYGRTRTGGRRPERRQGWEMRPGSIQGGPGARRLHRRAPGQWV